MIIVSLFEEVKIDFLFLQINSTASKVIENIEIQRKKISLCFFFLLDGL
jgi:hypothetical protein